MLFLVYMPSTAVAHAEDKESFVSTRIDDDSRDMSQAGRSPIDSVNVADSTNQPCSVSPSNSEDKDQIPVKYDNRGLANLKNRFIPKGNILVGATATWSRHEHDNYSFLIVENIYSDGYTFKFRPYVGYALRDNLMVGLRLGYSRANLTVDNLSINIGDEESGTHIDITDYQLLRHTFAGEIFGRYYIPLGQSKRVAILVDAEIGLAGSQARYVNGQPVKGTYETGTNFYIGVNPGMIVFLSNKFAIEATVGLFRFSYGSINQIHNQVDEGSASVVTAGMKINLLDVSLGLSFYL